MFQLENLVLFQQLIFITEFWRSKLKSNIYNSPKKIKSQILVLSKIIFVILYLADELLFKQLKTELLLQKLHFTITLQEISTVKTKKNPISNFIPTVFPLYFIL